MCIEEIVGDREARARCWNIQEIYALCRVRAGPIALLLPLNFASETPLRYIHIRVLSRTCDTKTGNLEAYY